MSSTIITALLFLPFIAILWLANLADRRRKPDEQHPVLAGLTYGILIFLYGGLFLAGLLLQVLAGSSIVQSPQTIASFEQLGIAAANVRPALQEVAQGLWLPALGALLLLLPPVRALLARVLPLDPKRTVHAVAASYTMLVVSNLMLTLGWGLGSMADVVEGGEAPSASSLLVATWSQELLWLLAALVGVGWLARRGLRETLRRLGIVRPNWRQIGIGLGAGLLMVPVALLIESVAQGLGVTANSDVNRLTDALLGPLFHSLPGVITLGLAAALGEESIFRGALQPRFGLLPTAALFALLHSNYGLSLSTLVVVILGLVLGIIRKRLSTTASMTTHAVYNMSLGMLAYLSIV